jgi:hypothetical protein
MNQMPFFIKFDGLLLLQVKVACTYETLKILPNLKENAFPNAEFIKIYRHT